MGMILRYTKPFYSNINYGHLIVALIAVTLLSIDPTFAQDLKGIDQKLSPLVNSITSDLGTTIATMGIIAIGFAFMTGRMDWMLALSITIGIVIIYGAATFASTFK